MNSIKQWAGDTAVKALKTFAQTFAGMLAANQTSIVHVDLLADTYVSALAALACVLHNVNSFPSTDPVVAAVLPSAEAIAESALTSLTSSLPNVEQPMVPAPAPAVAAGGVTTPQTAVAGQ